MTPSEAPREADDLAAKWMEAFVQMYREADESPRVTRLLRAVDDCLRVDPDDDPLPDDEWEPTILALRKAREEFASNIEVLNAAIAGKAVGWTVVVFERALRTALSELESATDATREAAVHNAIGMLRAPLRGPTPQADDTAAPEDDADDMCATPDASALRTRIEAIFPAFSYYGDRHTTTCKQIEHPGSTGPDPEPPDPCTCGGPDVFAALASGDTEPGAWPTRAEIAAMTPAEVNAFLESRGVDWRVRVVDTEPGGTTE